MDQVTTAPPADFLAGRDLENWPTRATDQAIAIEALRRHSERHGLVGLPGSLEKVSDADGGTYRITLPAWVQELEDRFADLYGPVTGAIINQKTLRWLTRTVFRENATVKIG